ncbi:hypothetical protein NAV33_07240 [Pseudomonas stutzeri]|uniref:phage pre-tape measure protein n=1 Tax=Stutzerimonas stutzeri TaxID=316 RepID=UPI00210C0765|nr:hypothetical protein [Stutzerimonas stutzeri]MCQ4311688.1 hypothetical protein [Stutzerimonas stutzeri]
MGLLDIKIPTTQVETQGGNFAVRGLSLEDFVNLHNEHTDEFGGVFDQFRTWASTEGDELPPLEGFCAKLLHQAPILAARVIAKAANEDSPAGLAMARQLSPLVQAEALQAIGRLTFRSEEDVKKMLALVIAQVKALTQALLTASQSLPMSEAGSGLFDPA